MEYTHYIAIDFGTAGCGIVVSTRISDSPRMYTAWLPGGPSGPPKCPTVMLLDHNGECEAFGKKDLLNDYYKKRVKYPNEIDGYYCFQYFKMSLYEEKDVSYNLEIPAMKGKSLPAITVFSKALQYMREIVVRDLNKQVDYPGRRILWILTVPAIWSHAARQLMRKAAVKAGFNSGKDSFTFALEPEAASLYCIEFKELLTSESINENTTNYHMIVDCGGGTVDIAVHKWRGSAVTSTLHIDEIHKVHGGPCGSFAVNKQFETFMKKLLQISDSEVLSNFESQWNKLIYRIFEKEKCSFRLDDKTITIAIPEKICEYINNKGTSIEELVKLYPSTLLEWDGVENELAFAYKFMLDFFTPVFNQIIQYIDTVLKTPECNSVTKIIFVGGFALSEHLENAIKKQFPDYTIEKGVNPWLSVLYGAIKFGKNRNIIRSRVMRQTIGIETWDIFVPGYHKEKYKISVQDKCYCTKIFTKFFEVNERISSNNGSKRLTITPIVSEHSASEINVYSSYKEGIQYTDLDDINCYLLGTLKLEEFPKPQSNLAHKVEVQIDTVFPEIIVTAKYIYNGSSKQLRLNLL